MSDDDYEFVPIKPQRKVKVKPERIRKPKVKRNRAKGNLGLRLVVYAALIAVGAIGSNLANTFIAASNNQNSNATESEPTSSIPAPSPKPTASSTSGFDRGSYKVVATKPVKKAKKKAKKKVKKVVSTPVPRPSSTINQGFVRRQRG